MTRFTLFDLIPYLQNHQTAYKFFVDHELLSDDHQQESESEQQVQAQPCFNTFPDKDGNIKCFKGVVKPATKREKDKDGNIAEKPVLKCFGPSGTCKAGKRSKFDSEGNLAAACRSTFGIQRGTSVSGLLVAGSNANVKLPLNKVLLLVWCWSIQMQTPAIIKATGLAKSTIMRWCKYFRDRVCVKMFESRNDICGQLGWDGTGEIQIDESLLAGRRKYNRGRILNGDKKAEKIASRVSSSSKRNYGNRLSGPWIFGLVWRKPVDGQMKNFEYRYFQVAKRDKATLVHNEVAKGSTIISDEWAAYRGLDQPPIPATRGRGRPAKRSKIYEHKTVCHKKSFVNPKTGAHTQAIEGLWSHLKLRLMRNMRGTSESTRYSHLAVEWWRSIHQNDDLFLAILKDAAMYLNIV